MVTEDYVSLETAKVLKEKGFDNNDAQAWYNPNSDDPNYPSPVGLKGCLSAITLQMARKWLKKEHNLFIAPQISKYCQYYCSVFDLENDDWCSWGLDAKLYDTEEEAIEETIKIALKKI